MDQRLRSASELPMREEFYDTPTLIFHWVTAFLVVVLFGTSLIWNYITPHDHYWRPVMEGTHVSLGILLAAVILLRLIWRFTGMRRLPDEVGISGTLSRYMYLILYLLLAAQIVLGFVLRWLQGEDFSFFGLFALPDVLTPDKALAGTVREFHNWVGWAIVILAVGHSAAALYHHYVLKDQVMQRMSFHRR